MVNIDFKGKVALVTGASRGLGKAAALRLAQAGADVVVHYAHNCRAAEAVAAQCRKFGVRAIAVKAEMASSAEIAALFRTVRKQLARLDILVCCAGIWKEATIERMTDAQLNETMAVNVRGVFACCRHAVPMMKRRQMGRIILVASTAGQRGEAFHSHYAASKGAIISLTKSLAPELAPHGILVNCIAPGWFDTDMSRSSLDNPKERRAIFAAIPLRRVGRPDEFAGAVLYLASDLSSFVTGEILNVNGGAVLVG